ncbi:conserved Plasmodium protein, unknown function [Plasmodium gallinaceum]|uniref:Uncharacterized protein n=1 Tax=Plasmodium gallinaceum TaxID=5849 RepID=A0A1J1GV39_PLAGA|nr:conserved Plasmodium protein, unknown function [Plasmodium gallinaceum]CRG94906.1 conserved Plasmodium protein, unknown function [Plasmodium gallinaceum]
MLNFSVFYFFMVLCILKYNYAFKNKKNIFLFLNKSIKNKPIIRKYKCRRYLNKTNDIKNINIGELKIGKIYDIISNDIYIQLKDSNHHVIIKRENNYLLENELLYEYLFNSNLIDNILYNKLMKKITKKNEEKNEINECVVLIKEINEKNEIIGELYTNEISKRKEKIYDKLNEIKNLEKKIFIKILKNVRNKYFTVLIHDCIKGFLLYDEEEDMFDSIFSQKLSAYIIDVNKKLEYVFLSMKKLSQNTLNDKLLNFQHTIILENLFENNYFKAEISDFCNDGNNVIVKIFDNKINSIKVKIKSHNIINTRNILRNFDYMKNKVIDNQFNKYNENTEDSYDDDKINMKKEDFDEKNINKRNKVVSKKDYNEKLKKFKEDFYGCKNPDALKYIDMDNYIYKKEKLLYVRIINKTSDKNMYEGSMVNSDIINQHIYDIIKNIANDENKVSYYDEKLRYPSKVLGFFNKFVILSTRILNTDSNKEGNNNSNIDENTKIYSNSNNNKHIKDVITLIEKRYIDYENLKEGDIFFCRFESVKRQSIRNVLNLSNSTINKIYNLYFKKEKNTSVLKRNIEENINDKRDNSEENKMNENKENSHGTIEKKKSLDQLKFEKIFFEKHNIYVMRAELHKDTEYRLNKNNIDKNFKSLKNICDNYYSGFNKLYNHYSSIREEFILTYLGKENYKLYRKIVSDYFSSNKHSYKEFLQVPCEELASTIFDFIFENSNELTVEMVKNYNEELLGKVKQLNIFELKYLLNDLIKLKNKLYIYPYTYKTKTGRMNLLLNNQKPIKREHIINLNIDNKIKEELLKKYMNIIYPIDYIRKLILIKKNSKNKENEKMPIIYILAEETIRIYENSAKDVEPFSDEQIKNLKSYVLKKKKNIILDIHNNEEENLNSALFDSENSQIRKILYMIKEDLDKQKKKNKIDEVDKEYEEEQKNYIDATEIHKNIPELEEMNKLTEDMFYMKIPFVE